MNHERSIMGTEGRDYISAFSAQARQAILQRADNQCEAHDGGCGFDRLEAAHIVHARGENYNSPDNGQAVCRPAHFDQHLNHVDPSLTDYQNDWAAQQIWLRMTPAERQYYITHQ